MEWRLALSALRTACAAGVSRASGPGYMGSDVRVAQQDRAQDSLLQNWAP